MNKFEKQLEKWNGGVLRGAQAKLAKILHVSTATVAMWSTGKRRPSKGYAAQMGQLFGLDSYDVMRLFPANTTYPEIQPAPRSLREGNLADFAYNADPDNEYLPQSNSISMPVFTRFPEHFPLYEESEVLEWWTLPRRSSKGARFLFLDQQETFYAVKPCSTWENNCEMWFRQGKELRLAHVKIIQEKAWLKEENLATYREALPFEEPAGTVLFRITAAPSKN